MALPPNLSRDAILSASDSKVEPLAVPEWGGTVYIRTITGGERDGVEYALSKDPATGRYRQDNFRAYFAMLVLCDESGSRLFKLQDIPALAKKNGAALERVVEAALKLNRFSEDDVEEMTKNSSSIQDEDSGSDLPDTLDAASESASDE